MPKNKTGPVRVFLDRNLLNGMLYCLDYLLAVSDGEWAKNAVRIKEKILKHGRIFSSNDTDCAAVYFYEDEAAVLLKAFSLFICLTRNPQKDYYLLMKNQKSEKTANR